MDDLRIQPLPLGSLEPPDNERGYRLEWRPGGILQVCKKINELCELVNRIDANKPELFDTPEGRRVGGWFADPEHHRIVREICDRPELAKVMKGMLALSPNT